MVHPTIQNSRRSVAFRAFAIGGTLLFAFAFASCDARRHPQEYFDRIRRLFLDGNFEACQTKAQNGYLVFRYSDPVWAGKFANQQTECLIWLGSYEKAIEIYSTRQIPLQDSESRVRALGLQVSANTHLRHLDEAHHRLREAQGLCQQASSGSCGNLMVASGMLFLEEDDLATARERFADGLAVARGRGDRFLEATALLDLGLTALRQRHFDEMADRNEETLRLSDAFGYRAIAQNARGNEAWAYYRLGNFDQALKLFQDGEDRASSMADKASWLIGIGKIQFERSKFASASAAFQRALKLEDEVGSKEYIYMAQLSLAQLSVETGDLSAAEQYSAKALGIAQAAKIRGDEFYPYLVQARIAVRQGRIAEAAQQYHNIELSGICPGFVKWEAQRLLAQLYEEQRRILEADHEYRSALTTFEASQPESTREELKISFLSNGLRVYNDYLHFLIANGRPNEALRWADHSRARTLAQELDPTSALDQTGPPTLAEQQIAAEAGGTLLFYWLGQKQSYLWAITPKKTNIFSLPPAEQIEAALLRYHDALKLSKSGDILSPPDWDGAWLYRTLVAPAQSLVPKGGRVFVFADGELNNFNFETLVVSDEHPHFWIEDATVICASSLRVLNRGMSERKRPATPARRPRALLLIGNSISPSDQYPVLSGATEQMKAVSGHFPSRRKQTLEGAQATPAAYLAANPEQYSIIHFVAHGTASRTSPLDSAIVLSRPADGSDAFKLYARDIVPHPVGADLVVISACYSAGESAFAGEGLVGLSWGFLRAGAHNVIAALGEASAASTVPLMDRFYDELNKGAEPDAALRTAKLALLHGDKFRTPFYWAPFQLYGSGHMQSARR